jgi:hypothetical protein
MEIIGTSHLLWRTLSIFKIKYFLKQNLKLWFLKLNKYSTKMIIFLSLQIHIVSITSFTTSRTDTTRLFLLYFFSFKILKVSFGAKLLHRSIRFLIFLYLFNFRNFFLNRNQIFVFCNLRRKYSLKMTHKFISVNI